MKCLSTKHLTNGLIVCLYEQDGFYKMDGGNSKHQLLVSETSPERLTAHWTGYVSNNGQVK